MEEVLIMNRSERQHQFAQKTGWSLLLGSLSWVALLIRGASVLRGQIGNSSYDVMFGPWNLHRITQEKTGDGLTVSFSFETGLLWYLLFWLLLGVVLGLLSGRWGSQNEKAD
jgi:hypothetical protein